MKTYRAHHLLVMVLALALGGVARADLPTFRVEPAPVALTHPAEATLEAVRSATLAAQLPGRIVELSVDAGDRVRRGQILARIDASEANQAVAGAEAQVAQAEANLLNARAAYERAVRLTEQRFVSQAALDQAQASYRAAQAQLEAARAGRGQAAVVRGHASIVAPFDGVVAVRHVEAGEMAQPGRALFTLYEPGAMRAVVDVAQQRLVTLAGGPLAARVELPELARWIDAAAVTVLPAADPRTHTQRVRVDLPPGEGGLVPGMFARVHFKAGEAPRLAVPAAAILRRGELTGVYVLDGKGGFGLRQIRLGTELADGRIEVLSGLAGGEEIALDPVRAGIVARAARAAAK